MTRKVPKSFRNHSKSCSKISNLLTTELFYAHILNMDTGSLHTRRFRSIHLSVFKSRLSKNGIAGPKSFQGFRETNPWSVNLYNNVNKSMKQTYSVHNTCWRIATDSIAAVDGGRKGRNKLGYGEY